MLFPLLHAVLFCVLNVSTYNEVSMRDFLTEDENKEVDDWCVQFPLQLRALQIGFYDLATATAIATNALNKLLTMPARRP